MRRHMTQQVLQIVYDRFCSDGGVWPTLGCLQRELNRQSGNTVDAVRILQGIPASLLNSLPGTHHYPAPIERLVLTAEGIARCTGSGEDIENLVTAVKWSAKNLERADLSHVQGALGVRFTIRQLAEAVSLSPDSDQDAVSRLVVILQSEGLMQDDGDTLGKGERVLYAHWDIRVYRGIQRFSDYKKVKARTRRVLDTSADVKGPRGQKRSRRSLPSNRGLTIIIAVGTVVLYSSLLRH
jgi:hypothetical protein